MKYTEQEIREAFEKWKPIRSWIAGLAFQYTGEVGLITHSVSILDGHVTIQKAVPEDEGKDAGTEVHMIPMDFILLEDHAAFLEERKQSESKRLEEDERKRYEELKKKFEGT